MYSSNDLVWEQNERENQNREMKFRIERYARSLCLLIDNMPDEILLKLLSQHNEFLNMFLEQQKNDREANRGWIEIIAHQPIGHPELTVHQVIRHPAKEV